VQLPELQAAGVSIALDDFGTGFSSINHFLKLPIDILKLDRMLVADIDHNDLHQALTAGTIEMAHRIGLTVVGEGVERLEERSALQDLGGNQIQGFLTGRPLTESSFVDHITSLAA
jgi:EAL domain-containing protein (putative c-di-GMP-specific phosphodiesterase class I)